MEFFFLVALIVIGFNCVDKHYDVRKYYDKPYCEKQKVGNETVEKCYKLVEVKKDNK